MTMAARWRKLTSPTSLLTREGRARRHFNCGKQAEWNERASREVWEGETESPIAAADFGAGNERLRPLLGSLFGEDVDYHPYDLHPQRPSTARLDVSQGLPERGFDLAVCLGLLEYLPSVTALAQELARGCRFALVSYVTADSPVAISRDDRLQHGWTTHLRGEEVEDAFAASGFRSAGRRRSDGEATTIWLWAASRR